jgi:hypothetical protein
MHVQRASLITWLGLAIALFAMIFVRHAVLYFSPVLRVSAAIWNEVLTWVSIGALCLIIPFDQWLAEHHRRPARQFNPGHIL